MHSWISRLLKKSPSPQATKTHATLRVPITVLDENIPRYPPFMKGLPVLAPDKLLGSQQELISQIASSVLVKSELYERHYLGAIDRFAEYAHLLPASQSHHHRGAGGLFRHSLEVALWSLQASDKMLLDLGRSASHRRELEPRWQLTAFLAGLCHDAGKPATDLVVSSHDRSHVWMPIKESLCKWAEVNGVDAYFLDWRAGRSKQHVALSNLIADRIITTDTLAWIQEGGTELIVWLMESLNGNPGTINPLYDLVIKADQASVSRDMASMGAAMAGYDLGVPVERHLTDIMRRLIKQGIWSINEPGARVWNIDGTIYLVWPAAGEEMARMVKDDGVPGIPRTGDGILEMLVERQLALVKDDRNDTSRFWKIAPAVLAAKIPGIALSCIRLRDDAMVSSTPIASVEGVILGDDSQKIGEFKLVGEAGAVPNHSELALNGNNEPEPKKAPIHSVPEHPPSLAENQHPVPTQQHIDQETGEISFNGNPAPTEPAKEDSVATTPPKQKKTPRSGPPTLVLDGPVGEALKALADDLKSGVKEWGREASVDDDERVQLLWPAAFAGYGLTSKVILEELSTKDWLWIDQTAPLKKVHEIEVNGESIKCIRLELEVSDALMFASGFNPDCFKPVAKSAPQRPQRPQSQPLPDEPTSVQVKVQSPTQMTAAIAVGSAVGEHKHLVAQPQTETREPAVPPATKHEKGQGHSGQGAATQTNEKPKAPQPKKVHPSRSTPRFAEPGEKVTLPASEPINPLAVVAARQVKLAQAELELPFSDSQEAPLPITQITLTKPSREKPPIKTANAEPTLEDVIGALGGLGDETELAGWKGVLLQKAKTAFKEAGFEIERSHLFGLSKRHSDKLKMAKGMVLYRVGEEPRKSPYR